MTMFLSNISWNRRYPTFLNTYGWLLQLRQYVRECLNCQKNKSENALPPSLLQLLPIPQALFTDINLNFMEDLSGSKGKEIIFVVLNRFNKYSHFMTFSHPYSAITVSIAFMDHVYKVYGFLQQ